MIELAKPVTCADEHMPTERLEAEICTLAGQLAAATCRLLDLIADYDQRRAWATWEMRSCAEWLSWKCQLAPGTARDHVRTARAIQHLPVIHREFAAGRMSYSKVRALARIATPETDADLAEMTILMTAGQVERFARAYHQCSQDQQAREPRRRLKWRFDPGTGEMSMTIQLPPAAGAVVLQALRAAVGDLDHPHEEEDKDGGGDKILDLSSGEWPDEYKVDAENLADALVEVSGNYLRGKITAADNADIYQVIIHTTADTLGEAGSVSAETPTEPARDVSAETPGDPCRTGRCHLEDGPAINPADAALISCDATTSVITHAADGSILSVGRRTRKVPPHIRRAVRERDGTRCGFPGCNSRRVDLHHIRWWSNGGETSLDNLMNLCRHHHVLIHAKRYIITRGLIGTYTLTDPATGTTLAPAGPLPGSSGPLEGDGITARTIQRASGERLDLHQAIWIALHNGKVPHDPETRTFYNIAPPGQQAA
jgi:5-methylcytosine-specific restriction endonuclease McrA